MDKLTSILAVAPHPQDEGDVFFSKVMTVARAFDARVTLLVCDPAHLAAFAALHGDEIRVCGAGGGHVSEEVVARMARSTGADLIVKRAAGRHPLRRVTFGPSDWQLAHDSPVPLLLLRDKPWSIPPKFAAAVDMAEGGSLLRSILHDGGFLALGCHAPIDVLYSEREERDERLRMERAVRLAQIVREFHVGFERLEILTGEPERTLAPLIASRGYDVLALGSHLAAAGMNALTGSLSARLIECFDGDVLFINDLEPARASGRPRAVRKQAVL